jgi:hypothetical protein
LEDLKGLLLELDFDTLLAQFPVAQVDLEDTEPDGRAGMVTHSAQPPHTVGVHAILARAVEAEQICKQLSFLQPITALASAQKRDRRALLTAGINGWRVSSQRGCTGTVGSSGVAAAESAVTGGIAVQGYCEMNGQVQNGACVGNPNLPICVGKGDSQKCPTGAKAIRPGWSICGIHSFVYVDQAGACSFMY